MVSSEYVAMAESCWVEPMASDNGEGVTPIAIITAGLAAMTSSLTPAELAAIVIASV